MQGFTTMINITNLIFSSTLSGLGSYAVKEASLDCPATALSGFGSKTFSTTVDIERSDVLVMLQYRVTGIETVWRQQASDYFLIYIPSFLSAEETIFVEYDISGTTLTLSSTVADTTGSSNTSPAYSVDARISLFTVPFAE